MATLVAAGVRGIGVQPHDGTNGLDGGAALQCRMGRLVIGLMPRASCMGLGGL